jgi:hypothetical protein
LHKCLDQDTKRRIDTASDILVGKLPNPQAQVETNNHCHDLQIHGRYGQRSNGIWWRSHLFYRRI